MIIDKPIPIFYTFNEVKTDLFIILAIGVTTNILTILFNPLLPEMPLSIPSLLGTAISILLSFKMNQSYDRWWEARKAWGAIVNDSRTLVMQLQSFLQPGDRDYVRRMAYRQIAWCITLSKSLRGLNTAEGLDHLITSQEQIEILRHDNKPLGILKLQAIELLQLKQFSHLETLTHIQLDNTLTRLCESMGKAERINNTVFPSTYRQFLHYSIYLFIIILSIALRQVNMMFEIPLLFFIGAAFFLIEKSAYNLQDPFKNRPTDVPSTAIAKTIEINIRQLLGETEVLEPEIPKGFYIL